MNEYIELTDREAAIRAAAIIDTDGCISIKQGSYSLRCTVLMTNPEIVLWLQSTYGGAIQHTESIRRKDGYSRKSVYFWEITSKKAEAFLQQIEKFLLIKRNQAQCGLEMRAVKSKRGKLNSEQKTFYLGEYLARMQDLNK